MITYKDLQGKLKTLHDKAVKNAVAELNKELKRDREDLSSSIDYEYGNGGDYALSIYLLQLQNTEIGLLWLLFGNPGWDGYEDKGTNGQYLIPAIIESGQYGNSSWDYNKSVPKEIKEFMNKFDRIYNGDEDEDLSEANKYFFGTENTAQVKKLFESSSTGLDMLAKVIESCAKYFDKWLISLSNGDKKSRQIMVNAAIDSGIYNGHTPWEGMDMVLGLFQKATEWPIKADRLKLYPFVNSDGDTVETIDDLFPAALPFIDKYLEKHCSKGFTALWNKMHPDDIRSKVTYQDFCGEEHLIGNVDGLGFQYRDSFDRLHKLYRKY